MLAILTSHPIQYQAPLWRKLSEDGRVPFEVWFLTPHAVCPSFDREFGRQFAWDLDLLEGYPHRFLDVRPGWRLDRFRGIQVQNKWEQLFRESGVTHLWVEGWRFSANWSAVRAASRHGIQVWLRGETNDLKPRSGLKEALRRMALGRLFSRVNHYLCIGTANRRFYQSFGILEEQLGWAPYAVDNDRFSKAVAELRQYRQEIRRGWGIPDDAFCLLYCGKFIAKKRPMDLIDAVRRKHGRAVGRPLHILFVGSGGLEQQVRAECQEVLIEKVDRVASASPAKFHPHATFTGFLNQMEISRAYVAADALVLPSDYGETWGLVANEAMACGLPCIVSNACGCAEDLCEKPSGYSYPMGDSVALATCIEEVASSPPSPDEMFSLISRFQYEKTVQTVLEFWKRRLPVLKSGKLFNCG